MEAVIQVSQALKPKFEELNKKHVQEFSNAIDRLVTKLEKARATK